MSGGVSLEFGKMQGVIVHPYRRPLARHHLFEFADPAGARRFLGHLAPRVTSAAAGPDPAEDVLVNIGVSYRGLEGVAVRTGILQEFPVHFRELPNPEIQGDYGDSTPDHWWGRRFGTDRVHLIVHIFARSAESLRGATEDVRRLAAATGVRELVPTSDGSPIECQHLGGGRLHFGYRDGLSQPDVAWSDSDLAPSKLDFRHFVLGYPTDRISSAPRLRASRPESPHAVALAKDGSYAVFRWLYQDVAAFNRFLVDEAPRVFPRLSTVDAEERLAANLLGRWRDGTPLAASPDRPDASKAGSNDFGYADDPDGRKTPLTAHVRVVNPRDQPLNLRASVSAGGAVPRVIRRGAPYGPELAGTEDDGKDRGLAGLFLCTSITLQFYTLMAWMNATDFSPAFGDPRRQDPFANRDFPGASRGFTAAGAAADATVSLRNFTRTRGTAFFLMPGTDGLRRLAEGGFSA